MVGKAGRERSHTLLGRLVTHMLLLSSMENEQTGNARYINCRTNREKRYIRAGMGHMNRLMRRNAQVKCMRC